MFYHYEEACTI